MSYSFTVKAATKADAKKAVASQLEAVVAGQPIHKADLDAALVSAKAFIDVLGEPHEGDEVVVSVNGSLSWNSDQANEDFIAANITVSAALRNKA
jgi:hypothetical protein